MAAVYSSEYGTREVREQTWSREGVDKRTWGSLIKWRGDAVPSLLCTKLGVPNARSNGLNLIQSHESSLAQELQAGESGAVSCAAKRSVHLQPTSKSLSLFVSRGRGRGMLST